jgi:hypothetical protein
MSRRGVGALLGGSLAACALVACSTGSAAPNDGTLAPTTASPAPPTPSAAPWPGRPALTAYDRAVLADGPVAVWPLDDLGAAAPGATARPLGPVGRAAELVEGRVADARGPDLGSGPVGAARFEGRGRLVTNVRSQVAPGRAFTLEFFFRPDDCTRNWTQVAGTASYDERGRQGVNVLHYPRFWPNGCRLAVEFWEDDRYQGGCGSPAVVSTGRWTHFVLTYDGRSARCYADGALLDEDEVTGFGRGRRTPLGIGGAGSGYGGSLDSGSLASVAFYARALTPAQVKAHVEAFRGARP